MQIASLHLIFQYRLITKATFKTFFQKVKIVSSFLEPKNKGTKKRAVGGRDMQGCQQDKQAKGDIWPKEIKQKC